MNGNVPLRCVVSVKITQLTWHLDAETSDTIFWFQELEEAYLESDVRWSRHLRPLNLPKPRLGPGLSYWYHIIFWFKEGDVRWSRHLRPLKLP